MTTPKIVCVTPSIRPESMKTFKEAWAPLFEKHKVTLITVWDGDSPQVEVDGNDGLPEQEFGAWDIDGFEENRNLFCFFTDACRNLGFLHASRMDPDYILTLDDDVVPCTDFPRSPPLKSNDPIQEHLDVLKKKVPISWMNTAHDTDLYLRGFPYGTREEAPVMLSHGVWVGVPDFDGETQLRLETCPRCDGKGTIERSAVGGGSFPLCPECGGSTGMVPYTLPYFVGPVPRGVSFPLCGMNVMVRREVLPYLYFAPMGKDSGFPDLHRFADIFMGIHLKREFDSRKWACYTGASTVLHTRASDAKKNMEQEKLGRRWLEELYPWNPVDSSNPMVAYFQEYRRKRERYETLIKSILGIKESR